MADPKKISTVGGAGLAAIDRRTRVTLMVSRLGLAIGQTAMPPEVVFSALAIIAAQALLQTSATGDALERNTNSYFAQVRTAIAPKITAADVERFNTSEGNGGTSKPN